MSSSAVAVLRSACYALRRRPPFPCALIENSSTRRFYSADCTAVGKAETNKPATVEDGVSRKLDQINRAFDAHNAAWKELAEQVRRRKVRVRRTIFAAGGVLAAVYAKKRFFSWTKEDNEEMPAANN